jgi:penicillin-binding protein 2
VIALASNPTYDPSLFVGGIKQSDFARLNDPANRAPFSDRAVQGLYSPGSTFKLATAIASLRDGLIAPNTPFVDTGSLKVGTQTFFNAGKRSLGLVNLPRAITVSSDSYFYNLGNKLWEGRSRFGDDAIQQVAHQLGWAEPTGIPIGETVGRVADPQSRKGRWFAGDNVNMAIGQGETVITPLELAQAYATFADGGTVHDLRVASRTADASGHTIDQIPPHEVRKVDLSPTYRNAILAGLKGAVGDPSGTAYAGFAGFPYSQYPLAGKTGTAQVSAGKQDTGLFVSFGPASNPQYVVAVVMEQSGFGGESAAPVARRIWDGIDGLGKPLMPVVHVLGVD